MRATPNDIPASVAWRDLPIDTSYQRSYSITASTWAAGTETLIISSPGGYGAYGEFQIQRWAMRGHALRDERHCRQRQLRLGVESWRQCV